MVSMIKVLPGGYLDSAVMRHVNNVAVLSSGPLSEHAMVSQQNEKRGDERGEPMTQLLEWLREVREGAVRSHFRTLWQTGANVSTERNLCQAPSLTNQTPHQYTVTISFLTCKLVQWNKKLSNQHDRHWLPVHLFQSSVAQEVERVVNDRKISSSIAGSSSPMRPWARSLTSNCSWWSSWCPAWQPPPSVYELHFERSKH